MAARSFVIVLQVDALEPSLKLLVLPPLNDLALQLSLFHFLYLLLLLCTELLVPHTHFGKLRGHGMVWEVIPDTNNKLTWTNLQNTGLLTRQSHLLRHFFDDALVEHTLVEEDQGIRGHEGH